MKALVYQGKGQIGVEERPKPQILDERDAIVEVTLTTICSSDIHIKHGAVPKAVPVPQAFVPCSAQSFIHRQRLLP